MTSLEHPAAADARPTPPVERRSPARSWVPIRSLAPRHKDRIAAHLLRLSERDRYLRFGYPATDEQVGNYAEGIDFERDEVIGIFNRRLELIAMAHLAYAPAPQLPDRPPMAEFGVSVEAVTSPVQPTNCRPPAGVAVSLTAVPWSYNAWFGCLVTLPPPTVVTFSA